MVRQGFIKGGCVIRSNGGYLNFLRKEKLSEEKEGDHRRMSNRLGHQG